MWLNMDGFSIGSYLTFILKSGSAEIDGFPLPLNKRKTIGAGYLDYFIHSWVGCEITIETNVSHKDMLMWIKSSTTAHQLLTGEFNQSNRVLVLDDTHNNALTVANYAYRRQPGPSEQHLMVNLDIKGNAGVCCFYKVGGAIPPHHPLDYLPEYKHMYWTNSDGLCNAVCHLKDLLSNANMVTLYMNTSRCTDEEVSMVVSNLNVEQVITTNDRRFLTLSKTLKCAVSKLVPHTNDHRASHNVDEKGVFRHVFLQQFKPHHFNADTGLQRTRFVVKMSSDLLPVGKNDNGQTTYCKLNVVSKNCKIYAIVSDLEGKLPSCWGFALVDYIGRCHTLFSRHSLNKLTFVYIMSYLK